MRGYKCGLLLLVLPYWAPLAVADTAPGGAAVSTVKAAPSAEEDYQAALKAGLDDDMVTSARLARRAAEQGHAAAQVIVAEKLWQGSAKKEAVEWFRKAAEQGYAEGQLGLAMMYMADQAEGKWEQKKDYAEARKWFVRAADQGNRQAIISMADAYINDKMDFDENARNSPDALAWIKRAADEDDVPAIRALASAYRSGKYGLAVDPKQADELAAKALKISGGVEAKKKSTKSRR